MGKHSIERGSQDTWTANPRRESAIAAKMAPVTAAGRAGGGGGGGRGGATTGEQDMALWSAIHAPELRDPRGYILPSDQVDFPTATKFVNTLLESGITVNRATRDFRRRGQEVSGRVVRRAHRAGVPAAHHRHVRAAGASGRLSLPRRSADATVRQCRMDDVISDRRSVRSHSRRLQRAVREDRAVGRRTAAGKIASAAGAAGFVTDNRVVNSFVAATRLLKSNEDVLRLTAPLTVNGKTFGAGALYVRVEAVDRRGARAHAAARRELRRHGGRGADRCREAPHAAHRHVGRRMAATRKPGGCAGCSRRIEFSFDRVFAQAFDAGNLDQKYDILIFPQGGIPGAAGGGRGGGGGGAPTEAIPNLPAEYQSQVGRVTVEQTLPKIRDFIEKGGTVLAIGTSAANLAEYLKLPIENQLVEGGAALPRDEALHPRARSSVGEGRCVESGNGRHE